MAFCVAACIGSGCGDCGRHYKAKNGCRQGADIAECIYNSGVAALTVSSMLRGIMDIAGTGSVYQTWMLYAGAVMAAAGAVIFAVAVLVGKSNGSRTYN